MSRLRAVLVPLARALGLQPGPSLPARLHSAGLTLLALGLKLYDTVVEALPNSKATLMTVLRLTETVAFTCLISGLGVGNVVLKAGMSATGLPPHPPAGTGGLTRMEAALTGTACIAVASIFHSLMDSEFKLPPATFLYAALTIFVQSALLYTGLRHAQRGFRKVNEELAGAAGLVAKRQLPGLSVLTLPGDVSELIGSLRVAHVAVTRSLATLARGFGLQCAAMLLYDLMLIVSNLFYFFTVVGVLSIQNKLVRFLPQLVVFPALHVVTTVTYAHLAVSEGVQTRDMLKDLINSKTTTAMEAKEVKQFLLATEDPPRVTVLHMFTLDPSLLLSMAQSIVTYVVILVQFTVSPNTMLEYLVDYL